MSTVASRTFRSSPHRDASTTWELIVELLTQGKSGEARSELRAVTGIVSSLISDRAPKDAPIVVTCNGPRTRIYCIYDDSAIDGSDANENVLGFDPLKDDWAVSLPCPKDDLDWVASALKKHSDRITARDLSAGINTESTNRSAAQSMTLDLAGFLKS